MLGRDFREMLNGITGDISCNTKTCADCMAYLNCDECPSNNNTFNSKERSQFWEKVYETLIKRLDEEEDLPFPRDNWDTEDIVNLILDKWSERSE